MTPKHRERIEGLLASLNDYEWEATFKHNDEELSEFNAIRTLRRRLRKRLEEPVHEEKT